MEKDEKKLPFKCPNPKCGTIFEQPLSWWFKKDQRFICTFCGGEFPLNAGNFPAATKKLLREHAKRRPT